MADCIMVLFAIQGERAALRMHIVECLLIDLEKPHDVFILNMIAALSGSLNATIVLLWPGKYVTVS